MRQVSLARRRSGRHTEGNGCSLWPSARAEDSESTGPETHPGESLTGATRRVMETWATPKTIAGGPEKGRGRSEDLQAMAEQWATPQARDYRSETAEFRHNHFLALGRQVLQIETAGALSSSDGRSLLPPCPRIGPWADGRYPTPAAEERVSTQNEGRVPHSRPSSGTPTLTGWTRRLNPLFVEWLMGWPPGWTDYAPVATESFQSWLLTHTELLRRL